MPSILFNSCFRCVLIVTQANELEYGRINATRFKIRAMFYKTNEKIQMCSTINTSAILTSNGKEADPDSMGGI